MIQFVIRDRDHPGYAAWERAGARETLAFPTRLVTRKGVEHSMGKNEIIELFTISVLAEAIDRNQSYLTQWEKKGVLPKPMFKIAGKRGRRLYSAAQVMNLHRLMWGKYQAKKNHLFDINAFAADVKKVFYQPDIVVDEQGRINRAVPKAAVAAVGGKR